MDLINARDTIVTAPPIDHQQTLSLLVGTMGKKAIIRDLIANFTRSIRGRSREAAYHFNRVWIKEPFIAMITQSQAQEMEANRANWEGEPSIEPFKKDEELAQWGDLNVVTQRVGRAIAQEQLRAATPFLDPNVLMEIGLTKANNAVSRLVASAMEDAPRTSEAHNQLQVREGKP